jgi:predicted metal-dependent hydrolase
MKLNDWPPQYQIRRSPRARQASLKISSRNGLEVILPMRYKLTEIPILLNEKRHWIEKNHDLLSQFNHRNPVAELPHEVYFHSIDEQWKINYLFSPIKTQIIQSSSNELTVLGNIDDYQNCLAILKQWLRQKAEQILSPRFHHLSQELNLPFKDLTIRSQKTRWGSCSSQKTINLNFKLIFLSPVLVRHIMIHELCHTLHLNHSRKFWQLVARHDAQWQDNHKQSRRIEDQLPSWVDV